MMKTTLAILAAVPLAACTSPTTYRVAVDGLAADAGTIETYALEPVTRVDPLLWRELAACIERTFEVRGWRRVDDLEAADSVVAVSFGISDPEEYEAVAHDPVWGQTGTTTTHDYGSTTGFGYQSTTTTTPIYGVTHYETRAYTAVRYHRHLDFEAHDRRGEPQWRLRLRSSGWSNDLRQVIPYMLAAARPHVGRSTGEIVDVSVSGGDRQAERIAGR